MIRAFLLAAAILHAPVAATAQQERRPLPRIPLPPPPAPPLPRAALPQEGPLVEPAPVPNRRIEAPRGPFAEERPRVEPTIIEPPRIERGQTFGRDHAPDRQDQLFREPAAGARLRIPLN
jgi:hypothetical protein